MTARPMPKVRTPTVGTYTIRIFSGLRADLEIKYPDVNISIPANRIVSTPSITMSSARSLPLRKAETTIPASLYSLHLRCNQPIIDALPSDKLIMGSRFRHPPLMQNDDVIHILHPVQSVRREEYPLILKKHPLLQLVFRLDIQMGRRLIQRQNPPAPSGALAKATRCA